MGIKYANDDFTEEEVMALFSPVVREWFNRNFKSLTPPQKYAFPYIHKGENVLIFSPTGSGKTLAAFLSIVNELFLLGERGELEDKVYCLYISPLRALSNDIYRNLEKPLTEIKELANEQGIPWPEIRKATRTGDTSTYERSKMLHRPPHILITTPESLALMLNAPKFSEKLKSIKWVIVDEVHELSDNKRGVHLSLSLERLQNLTQKSFVRIGLSATQAPIEEIAKWLVGYNDDGSMRDVTIVNVYFTKELDIYVLSPVSDLSGVSYESATESMYRLIKKLVEEHRTTLIFTNTRSGTERVAFKLKELFGNQYIDQLGAHHSSLSKFTRLDVEEKLKRGDMKAVITSTSLELGIDIGYIDLVVQIGSPKSVAKGLQRIGRAGHALDRPSKGRLIVFDRDDVIECAVLVKSAYDGKIDRVQIPKNALDVLAQHIVGMSLERRWNVKEAYRLVRRSYNYHTLSKEDFMNVLRYLAGFYSDLEERQVYRKIWFDEDEGIFGRKASSRMIYYLNIGTIPDEADYTVVLDKLRTPLGHLSEAFVERLSPGDVFVLGGKTYLFKRVSGTRVIVSPAEGRRPTVPSWVGEMLPRSFDLSVDIGRFREELASKIREKVKEEELINWLVKNFRVDKNAAISIINYFKEQIAFAGLVPTHQNIILEEYYDARGRQNIIFHAAFGRRTNDALSRAYAFVISNRIKGNISTTITDNGFMLTLPLGKKFPIEEIKDMLSPENLEDVLKRAIRNTELFKLRFRHCATRSFMVLRKYRGHSISVSRQTLRSRKVLTALEMHPDFPVLKETFREILEDHMDINNARQVLQWIRNGDATYVVLRSGSTPSPFAHSLILTSAEDVVLMEDRDVLLRELHRQVIEKVLATTETKSLFSPDIVDELFLRRQHLTEGTKGSTKEDILIILKDIGPAYLFREQKPSIFERMNVKKDLIIKWCNELLEERRILSMRLPKGDPRWIAMEEYPLYVNAMRLSSYIDDDAKKVLSLLENKKEMTSVQIGRALNLKYSELRPILKKLEHAFLITKSKFTKKGKESVVVWSLTEDIVPESLKKEAEAIDRNYAIQRLILLYLKANGPSTLLDLATWLGRSEEELKSYINVLEKMGLVYSGFYTPLKQKPQYIRAEDREILKEIKNEQKGIVSIPKAVINEFVLKKQFLREETRLPSSPKSVLKILSLLGPVQTERTFWSRMKKYSHSFFLKLQDERKVVIGRLWRGRICFALADHVPLFIALTRGKEYRLSKTEERILDIIRNMGPIKRSDIVKISGYSKQTVKRVLDILESKLYVLRYAYQRTGSLDFNKFIATDSILDTSNILDAEYAARELVYLFIRGHGPVPIFAITWATKLPVSLVEYIIIQLEKEKKIISLKLSPEDTMLSYLTIEDYNTLIDMKTAFELGRDYSLKNEIRIISSFDPYSWRRAKQEMKDAYGSSWGSIILLDGKIIGAFEWSVRQGTFHITNLKLSSAMEHNKNALTQLARELISLCHYFGASNIEIEEINGIPSANTEVPSLIESFRDAGFKIIDNRLMHTHGIGISFSRKILQEWAIRHFLFHPTTKPKKEDIEFVVKRLFKAWFSCLTRRKLFTDWDELWKTVNELVREKKLIYTAGGVIHIDNLPIYYHVYKQDFTLNKIDKAVLSYINENGPISKREIIDGLKIDSSTLDQSIYKLARCFEIIRVFQDTKGTIKYWTLSKWLPDAIKQAINKLDSETAKMLFVYRWLHALGLRTADQLYSWIDGIIPPIDLRNILQALEDEGKVISGYLYSDRKQAHYMTTEDYESLVKFAEKYSNSTNLVYEDYTFTLFGYPRIAYFFDKEIHDAFGSTPGWIIFVNGYPAAAVISRKQKPTYIVRDIKILPEYLNEKYLNLILGELEKSIKSRGFKKIVIEKVNNMPLTKIRST